MVWKLKIKFSDGSSEMDDEEFETRDEAENKYDEWLDSWNAGTETLELAGEDFIDADIDDCEIWEE